CTISSRKVSAIYFARNGSPGSKILSAISPCSAPICTLIFFPPPEKYTIQNNGIITFMLRQTFVTNRRIIIALRLKNNNYYIMKLVQFFIMIGYTIKVMNKCTYVKYG